MRTDEAVLNDRGVIALSGRDARSFLQRLITNDIDTLTPGAARYAALLTPQGKITTDFLVVSAGEQDDDLFYLDVPEATAESLAKTLAMYRLRAEVRIEDRGHDLGILVFADATAPVETQAVFDDPRAPGLWRRAIVRRDLLRELGGDAGRWAYRKQRIKAGVPEGGIDFVYGETFPHEANLDRLHGVDFRKGCYIGQEVVSRVQHRGTARKRIVLVHFEDEPPPVGADITLDGASIGTMGSAIEGLGLGLVRIDRAEEARRDHGRILAGDVALDLEIGGFNLDQKSA